MIDSRDVTGSTVHFVQRFYSLQFLDLLFVRFLSLARSAVSLTGNSLSVPQLYTQQRRHSTGTRGPWAVLEGIWRARGARDSNGGLGTRDRTPGQWVRGRSPLKLKPFKYWTSNKMGK